MVKSTCTGRNLLNHCKQTGKPDDITYVLDRYVDYTGSLNHVPNYDSIKNPGSSFICTLKFADKTYFPFFNIVA
jgi:hypothetical protein